jgi:hypothetical protein
MIEDKRSPENLRLVYAEANNNRRHYSNLRFAVLTVFFAVIGGVGSVAFGIVEIKSPPSLNVMRWARIAGLLFTLVFSWFEVLLDLNLRHFLRIAKGLEDSLGYTQFKARKFHYMPRAIYATWCMYALIIAFWVYSIWRG